MNSATIQACAIGGLLLLGGAFVPVQAQQPVDPKPAEGAAIFTYSLEGEYIVRTVGTPAEEAARGEILSRQIVDLLNSQEQMAAARIDIRIAEMKQVVDLSEQQLQKLTVAGKTAVKSYMKDIKTKIRERSKNEPIKFDSNDKPETKDSAKEVDPAILISSETMWRIFSIMGSPNLVENEPVWKSSVKNVLTEPQANKLQQRIEQRNADRQSAAVRHFIARLDEALRLSPDQKAQLFVVLKENYGQLLADEVGNQSSKLALDRNAMAAAKAINGHVPGFDMSLVEEILTESQAMSWQRHLGIELHVLETNKKSKE